MGVLSEVAKELNSELRKRDVEHDSRIMIMLEIHEAGKQLGNAEENYALMLKFLNASPKADTIEIHNYLESLLYEIID